MALLTSLLVTSGVVFRVVVKSHMAATATAEISRKLRGITDQLNDDFKGLRKDAEIFIAWVPNPVDVDGKSLGPTATASQIDRYERFDRIMFFADGDFQSYNEWSDYLDTGINERIIRGDTARIVYMLAKDDLDHFDAQGNMVWGNKPESQEPHKRILGRSQHIFTGDSKLVDLDPATVPDPLDPATRRIRWIDPSNIINQLMLPAVLGQYDLTGAFTQANENYYEFDNFTLNEWINLPPKDKQEMLTVISDQKVYLNDPFGNEPTEFHGMAVNVDSKPPLNVHQLLCQGVGSFSIQGWYADTVQMKYRWFPEIARDINGDLVTDFEVDPGDPTQLDTTADSLRLIYPWPWYLDLNPLAVTNNIRLGIDGSITDNYPRQMINQASFNSIPGLGRALKFTFTLYDSRGFFKEGKKFTHIVYLDD